MEGVERKKKKFSPTVLPPHISTLSMCGNFVCLLCPASHNTEESSVKTVTNTSTNPQKLYSNTNEKALVLTLIVLFLLFAVTVYYPYPQSSIAI